MTRKNKNLTITLVVLFIAAISVTFYFRKTPPVVSNDNPAFILTASFICSDNTHFIAEFPKDDQVNIIVDGNLVRTLNRVEGVGERFEDTSFSYVFAGEEASVLTKNTNRTAICTQPVNPNLAPVNFGDAGEGGGVKPDLTVVVGESILGKWKSTDDTKFVREFADGAVTRDYYEDKAVTVGTWKVFTKEKPLTVTFALEANTSYIEIIDAGTQADKLHFKVAKVTPEELELIYMERGGTLKFTRVQ